MAVNCCRRSRIRRPALLRHGQAAAVWPGTGLPGEVATLQQTEQFLAAYERTAGHSWSDQHLRAAWAAGLWTRAFDANKPRVRLVTDLFPSPGQPAEDSVISYEPAFLARSSA